MGGCRSPGSAARLVAWMVGTGSPPWASLPFLDNGWRAQNAWCMGARLSTRLWGAIPWDWRMPRASLDLSEASAPVLAFPRVTCWKPLCRFQQCSLTLASCGRPLPRGPWCWGGSSHVPEAFAPVLAMLRLFTGYVHCVGGLVNTLSYCSTESCVGFISLLCHLAPFYQGKSQLCILQFVHCWIHVSFGRHTFIAQSWLVRRWRSDCCFRVTSSGASCCCSFSCKYDFGLFAVLLPLGCLPSGLCRPVARHTFAPALCSLFMPFGTALRVMQKWRFVAGAFLVMLNPWRQHVPLLTPCVNPGHMNWFHYAGLGFGPMHLSHPHLMEFGSCLFVHLFQKVRQLVSVSFGCVPRPLGGLQRGRAL